MLRRSDKRSDRVEISPEQLTAAAIEAESLGARFQRNIQVLGWYHSHPHITVWPSHVGEEKIDYCHAWSCRADQNCLYDIVINIIQCSSIIILNLYLYYILDVRTQSDYQTMSPDFIGLIFSCFHEENMVSLSHTCDQFPSNTL